MAVHHRTDDRGRRRNQVAPHETLPDQELGRHCNKHQGNQRWQQRFFHSSIAPNSNRISCPSLASPRSSLLRTAGNSNLRSSLIAPPRLPNTTARLAKNAASETECVTKITVIPR